MRQCGYQATVIDSLLCLSTATQSTIADKKGTRLSYGGLIAASSNAAKTLSGRHGIWIGDTIAIAPINDVGSLVAILGSWLTGARVAIIDPLSHSIDLGQQLEQIGAKLLITTREFSQRHCGVAEKLGTRCLVTDELSSFKQATTWEGYYRPRGWEEALIYFYAGIAGRTLPVIHTHGSVAASAHIVREHYGLTSSDRSLVVAPISHALGLQISLLAGLVAGATVALYTRTRGLDPADAARYMELFDPSIVLSAPGFFRALLDAGYRGNKSLRYPVSAGAPLPVELQRLWQRVTGVELLQLYGMTEAAPVSATLPGRNPLGSIGVPMPGVEVRLESSGGEGVGELLVRGPMVMKGYSDDKETSRVFTRDGWLHTGDIIELRDGFLYFRGVKKRMIKYKGYPVFPRDLELILEKHPAISKAVVRGEPSGDVGQIPVAEVWLRKGTSVSEEELMEWVNSRVAPYKKIRRLVIRGYSD